MNMFGPRFSTENPRPSSSGFHHHPVCGAVGWHTCAAGTVTADRLMPPLSIEVPLVPYPTKNVAPAMFTVGTPLRMVTAAPCDDSTPVTYACSVEADTPTSCPLAESC